MDKPIEGDRWHKTSKGRMPTAFKAVLVEVDGAVREGFYNDQRKMWFCGERPIWPVCWRMMPLLPKGMKK